MKEIFKHVESLEIENVIAGGSNGSIIILDIGNKEFSLFVYCAWRLDNDKKVITGWNESNDPTDGELTLNIKALKGDIIKKVEIGKYYDLKLHFKSKRILNVFCDITPNYPNEDCDENWVLADKVSNKAYTISNKFIITETEYS